MKKVFHSQNYNYIFNLENGLFIRWGKTKEDNPSYSEFGPEILDIEISTICSNNCSFCYKSNKPKGKNMTLETFKQLFDKFPKTLTQIAFGIGDIDANKDLWEIMDYCRKHNVIPNITINGKRMTETDYDNLVKYCGAVAVSLYDENTCYNAVQELTKRGLKQTNIHCLLADETFERCKKVMCDSLIDQRLKNLNAIVFLWLKPKGQRNIFHQLTDMNKFKELIDFAFKHNIKIGFDSCSSSNFLKAIKNHPDYKSIEEMVEPCESTLFSFYINVEGKGFPCSFSEGIYNGIDILASKDFIKDVWFGAETVDFRQKVLNTEKDNICRKCPLYNLQLCEATI